MRVEVSAEEIFGSFFSEEFRTDPYPFYARLRELGPLHPSPLGGSAVVTHAACSAVLHHPAITNERAAGLLEMILSSRATPGPFIQILRTMMVFRDPPDHTRLRGLVNKAFTPRAVAELRDTVGRLVDDLLRPALERRRLEVISELARPLPALVVCEMLGVPGADREEFQQWSSDLIAQIDVAAPPEALEAADASGDRFFAYFRDLIADRSAHPGDDVLTSLIVAEEEGHRLTEDEIIATGMLLLIAGYETTMNLLGNGTLALVRSPDVRRRLVEDPELIRPAVEELLRFDSPTQLTQRSTTEDIEVEGVRVPAGEQLILLLGSANRDEGVFADPDGLDIDRASNGQHLAFGHGIHFCLGAPLARLEGQLAFSALLRAAPEPELATDHLEWRANFTMRGLVELPIRW